MKIITSLLLATLCTLALSGGLAVARIPTPTQSPTPVVAPPPTPIPVNQLSVFEGGCWLDSRQYAIETLTARIGGTFCVTTVSSYVPPDGTGRLYRLEVPSNQVVPG